MKKMNENPELDSHCERITTTQWLNDIPNNATNRKPDIKFFTVNKSAASNDKSNSLGTADYKKERAGSSILNPNRQTKKEKGKVPICVWQPAHDYSIEGIEKVTTLSSLKFSPAADENKKIPAYKGFLSVVAVHDDETSEMQAQRQHPIASKSAGIINYETHLKEPSYQFEDVTPVLGPSNRDISSKEASEFFDDLQPQKQPADVNSRAKDELKKVAYANSVKGILKPDSNCEIDHQHSEKPDVEKIVMKQIFAGIIPENENGSFITSWKKSERLAKDKHSTKLPLTISEDETVTGGSSSKKQKTVKDDELPSSHANQKVRHYDQTAVQQYIKRQKVKRKEAKVNADNLRRQEEEEMEAQLKELHQKKEILKEEIAQHKKDEDEKPRIKQISSQKQNERLNARNKSKLPPEKHPQSSYKIALSKLETQTGVTKGPNHYLVFKDPPLEKHTSDENLTTVMRALKKCGEDIHNFNIPSTSSSTDVSSRVTDPTIQENFLKTFENPSQKDRIIAINHKAQRLNKAIQEEEARLQLHFDNLSNQPYCESPPSPVLSYTNYKGNGICDQSVEDVMNKMRAIIDSNQKDEAIEGCDKIKIISTNQKSTEEPSNLKPSYKIRAPPLPVLQSKILGDFVTPLETVEDKYMTKYYSFRERAAVIKIQAFYHGYKVRKVTKYLLHKHSKTQLSGRNNINEINPPIRGSKIKNHVNKREELPDYVKPFAALAATGNVSDFIDSYHTNLNVKSIDENKILSRMSQFQPMMQQNSEINSKLFDVLRPTVQHQVSKYDVFTQLHGKNKKIPDPSLREYGIDSLAKKRNNDLPNKDNPLTELHSISKDKKTQTRTTSKFSRARGSSHAVLKGKENDEHRKRIKQPEAFLQYQDDIFPATESDKKPLKTESLIHSLQKGKITENSPNFVNLLQFQKGKNPPEKYIPKQLIKKGKVFAKETEIQNLQSESFNLVNSELSSKASSNYTESAVLGSDAVNLLKYARKHETKDTGSLTDVSYNRRHYQAMNSNTNKAFEGLDSHSQSILTEDLPQFAPSDLKLRISAELMYQDTMGDALNHLKDLENLRVMTQAQENKFHLASSLQQFHDQEHKLHKPRNEPMKEMNSNAEIPEDLEFRANIEELTREAKARICQLEKEYQERAEQTINQAAQQLYKTLSQGGTPSINIGGNWKASYEKTSPRGESPSEERCSSESRVSSSATVSSSSVIKTLEEVASSRVPSVVSERVAQSSPDGNTNIQSDKLTATSIPEETHETTSNEAHSDVLTDIAAASSDSLSISLPSRKDFFGIKKTENINNLLDTALPSNYSSLEDNTKEEVDHLNKNPSIDSERTVAFPDTNMYSESFEPDSSDSSTVTNSMNKFKIETPVKGPRTYESASNGMQNLIESLENPSSTKQARGALQSTLTLMDSFQKEEELRFNKQKALLKLQEQSLVEEAKRRLAAIQEEGGQNARKKARAVLIQLREQQSHIRQLIETQNLAAQQRQLSFSQHQNLLSSTISHSNVLSYQKILSSRIASPITNKIQDHILSSGESIEIFSLSNPLSVRTSPKLDPMNQSEEDIASSKASCKDDVDRNSVSRNDKATSTDKQMSHREKERFPRKEDKVRKRREIHQRSSSKNSVTRYPQEEVSCSTEESAAPSSHDSHSSVPEDIDDAPSDRRVAESSLGTSPVVSEEIVGNTAGTSLAGEVRSEISSHIATQTSSGADGSGNSKKSDSDIKSNINSVDKIVTDESASAIVTTANHSTSKPSYTNGDNSLEKSSSDSEIMSKRSTRPASYTSGKEGKTRSIPFPLRVPLSPRSRLRQPRRYSSESDDSFTLSQNETASDVSDTEGKLLALRSELAARKAEAAMLQKEKRRLRRERSASQEQALLKQIATYNAYIKEAKMELEKEAQELQNVKAVKPLIKKPQVAESKRLPKIDQSSAAEKTELFDEASLADVSFTDKFNDSQSEKQDSLASSQYSLDSRKEEEFEDRKETDKSKSEASDYSFSFQEEEGDTAFSDARRDSLKEASPNASDISVEEECKTGEGSVGKGESDQSLSMESSTETIVQSPKKSGSMQFNQWEEKETKTGIAEKEETTSLEPKQFADVPSNDITEPELNDLDIVSLTPKHDNQKIISEDRSESISVESSSKSGTKGDNIENKADAITELLMETIIPDSIQHITGILSNKERKVLEISGHVVSHPEFQLNSNNEFNKEDTGNPVKEYFSIEAKISAEREVDMSSDSESCSAIPHSDSDQPPTSPVSSVQLMKETSTGDDVNDLEDLCSPLQISQENTRLDPNDLATRLRTVESSSENSFHDVSKVDEKFCIESYEGSWFQNEFWGSGKQCEQDELELKNEEEFINAEIARLEEIQRFKEQHPYLVIREVPNKPPPPYTPPGPGPGSVIIPPQLVSEKFVSLAKVIPTSEVTTVSLPQPQTAANTISLAHRLSEADLRQLASEISNVILTKEEDVLSYINSRVEDHFREWKVGLHPSSLKAEDDIALCMESNYTKENEKYEASCSRIFKRLLFDLTKQFVTEIYDIENAPQKPLWNASCHNKYICAEKKITNDNLSAIVRRKVRISMGWDPPPLRESSMVKWATKRTDPIEKQILVHEVRLEEQSWTEYGDDEVVVKKELSQDIFSSILKDTLNLFTDIINKKYTTTL